MPTSERGAEDSDDGVGSGDRATGRYEVISTDDPLEMTRVLEPTLAADPVGHNVPLSIIDLLRRKPGSPRCWWVADDAGIEAFAVHGGPGYSAYLSRADRGASHQLDADVLDLLAGAIMETHTGSTGELALGGVNGEIELAGSVAARLANAARVPAAVSVTQQYYRLDVGDLVRPAPRPEGRLRPADEADMPLLTPWAVGFQRDALGNETVDTEALTDEIRWKVDQGEVWLWETDEPVAMTAATRPQGGVSRIQHVYTPPERRGRGLAAACVAAVVEGLAATAGVETCTLFTDLANPTSNGVYQRLGFTPIGVEANVRIG